MSRPLKIAMLTGSLPPDACGVGGYTAKLVSELQSAGVEVEIISEGPWTLSELPRLKRAIRNAGADILHIQYPTVGFNRSLVPQALSLSHGPVVVTIHEVSQVHTLRRLSLYPFSIRSDLLIFSNQFDRDYAVRFAPWIASRTRILPLGASLPAATEISKTPGDVVCFGLIRPQKGLEEFIEAAEIAKESRSNLKFSIVGLPDHRFPAYLEALRKRTQTLDLTWELGMDDSQTAARLARAQFAYLPYPDGVTERRTSMMALVASGTCVVTTASQMTPDFLRHGLTIAENPSVAVDHLRKLASDPAIILARVQMGKEIALKFDWREIARLHRALYTTIAVRHA